jgi:predicted ester cyclase
MAKLDCGFREGAMTRAALRKRYDAYIEALNSGRLDEAAEFYHETVVINGEAMSRADFRIHVLGLARQIAPDARVELKSLVVDGDELAARLVRTGTSVIEYMGLKPTGRPVSFGEHAFYHLRDGRVDEAWSIIDLAALMAGSAA